MAVQYYRDPTTQAFVALDNAGPLGPTGPAGPAGVAGPVGPPGELTQATANDLYVNVTGDTMSGGLTISYEAPLGNGPSFRLNTTPGHAREILGTTDGLLRWGIFPGNGAVEAGANVGSDFSILRYADDGSYIDAVLTITRATGRITVMSDPVDALGVATKQYVDESTPDVYYGTASPPGGTSYKPGDIYAQYT